MIHPDTTLKFINDTVGYGVFATKDIYEGTIVYVRDSLELVVTPSDYLTHSGQMRDMIDKYSYIDQNGDKVISWDMAKYVNHCCNCNTISTGYGFEIAIRDIKAGEEITDEYGIFNLDKEMPISCNQAQCRKRIRPSDFKTYYKVWDKKIIKSLEKINKTDQPLISFLDPETKTELDDFMENPKNYKSVYSLKFDNEKDFAILFPLRN